MGGLYLFLEISRDELLLLENANLHKKEETLTARLDSKNDNNSLNGKTIELIFSHSEKTDFLDGKDICFEKYTPPTETSSYSDIPWDQYILENLG